MTDQTTILVFCANEQKETDQVLSIDGNGEIVLTCECGRFIKYPKGTSSDELKAGIVAHKQANEGQVSVEALEAQKEALLKELAGE